MEPLKSGPFEVFDSFDVQDPKNLGRPFFFDLKMFLATVEMLICSDEVERALWLLDNAPAWYRQNPPPEFLEYKKILFKNLYDNYEYSSDSDEAGWTKEDAENQVSTGYAYPRYDILRKLVMDYNERGLTPYLCELSTSHGLLPLGLQKEGLKFNFFGKNLNHPALVKLQSWLNPGVWCELPKDGQPRIFVFTEALEHAAFQEDLRRSYMKLGIEFDDIILSVPLGTLGGGLSNWRTRRIGHIRAYTPKEFADLAVDFFPGYNWTAYQSVSVVMHGKIKHAENT